MIFCMADSVPALPPKRAQSIGNSIMAAKMHNRGELFTISRSCLPLYLVINTMTLVIGDT